jgi:hypothetical protein
MLYVCAITKAQIVQELPVGLQTPNIPTYVYATIEVLYFFFIVGGEEFSLYALLMI